MWKFEVHIRVQYMEVSTPTIGKPLQQVNVRLEYEANGPPQLFLAKPACKEEEESSRKTAPAEVAIFSSIKHQFIEVF